MITVRRIEELPYEQESIITVGTFDGVHRGHQQIVRNVVERASRRQARSVLVTFDPHPREVVGRGPVQLLTTLDERIELLSHMKLDWMFIIDFTFEFSRLTPREFYETYLFRGIGVREVVVGHDHMFGRDRTGSIESLRAMAMEFGFTVYQEPPLKVEGEIVGSSRIRELLLRGEVEKAATFLGRNYMLDGVVVKGDGQGTTIGFPTANLRPTHKRKLIPAVGVYAVRVEWAGRTLQGMLNIGFRPTLTDGHERTIEVHLFDFREAIYGEPLRLSFVQRLRGEQKFDSVAELTAQLRKDERHAREILQSLDNYVYQGSL